jgi:glycosyltransferase involved in cell wall biosynthesis
VRTLAVFSPVLSSYHHVRLSALAARADAKVLGIEEADGKGPTGVPGWRRKRTANAEYDVITICPGMSCGECSVSELARRLTDTMARIRPIAAIVPGWSHPGALAALKWCLKNGRPAVLMSASTAADRRRSWWREGVKRRVARLYAGALVGGTLHAQYAEQLGLPTGAIVTGYDVVDNGHFDRGAMRARRSAEASRRRLGLPERFFLASGRFVPKKNLMGLLEAYAGYRRRSGVGAWHLVLLGDGELRPELERRIGRADLAGNVILPGFRQYDELPAWYGLASAFVHASTTEQWGLVVNEAMASRLPVIVSDRCGCAPDLVKEGVNGFTFDPCDVDGLAKLMQRVAAMTDAQRRALGEASRHIIAHWGPERFAEGLIQAVEAAMSRPPPKASLLDQALLWALARRPL